MPDEDAIIRRMTSSSARLPGGYLGPGDDVALVPTSRGRVVVKVDMLVGKTDVPRGMTMRQAARKAVAMCVSDFASKGVRPDSFLVSLGIPRGSTARQVEEVALGLYDAASRWKLKLLGGDTNEAGDLIVDCVMLGSADRIVRRSGARPGEAVVTSGFFGYPPSGLKIMLGSAVASQTFKRRALRSVVLPTPNLEVGVALKPFLTSAMDSSDGLSKCLHTLAECSEVGILVERIPIGPGVSGFAKANGLDADELVLAGGEEYEIVGTVKVSSIQAAREAARNAGGNLIVIGETNELAGSVRIRRGKRIVPLARRGWTHLA